MSEEVKETMEQYNAEIEASLEKADSTEALAWNKVNEMKEAGTVLSLVIGGVVNGGVIVYVEGIRGFIPASLLSTQYVEDLNTWLEKEVEAKIITVEPADNRLVLSAKAVEQAKQREAQKEKVESIKTGAVLTGKVENIMPYGAFVQLEDGISGLIHISQFSQKRIKSPNEVVEQGQEVQVKVIKVADGKISLSMKALEEPSEEDESFGRGVEYKEEEKAETSLGDLLSKIQL
ncbi:MAG: S1 RNA-binding domain-containing protein [Anaerostipes sp.]|jgi:small subunit ribosomal protein S1|nr:S1 RNA-binding domain-containing protein [Anaerostipes sp.]MDD3745593.1 S1 RNA-binding domain-containing protein [Anaerostipes sp.]